MKEELTDYLLPAILMSAQMAESFPWILMYLMLIFHVIEGKCVCFLRSCTCKNMMYIPHLPKDTVQVKLYQCHFPVVNRTLFENLSGLLIGYLTIDSCNVHLVTKDAFLDFHDLRNLKIDNNNINPKHLRDSFYSLNNSKIEELTITNNYLQNIPSDFFTGLASSGLKELHLQDNKIQSVQGSAFSVLKKLQGLLLCNNKINIIVSWEEMMTLQLLDLSQNQIETLPPFKTENGPLMPNLQYLLLDFNLLRINVSSMFDGLISLESLTLSNNMLTALPKNAFAGLPRLQNLLLSENYRLTKISSGAFNSKSLKMLDLSGTDLHLILQRENIFYGCHSLEGLQLDDSNLKIKQGDSTFKYMFKSLRKLNMLYLAGNFIESLDDIEFPSMLEKLYLRNNSIKSWKPHIWRNIRQFKLIKLNKNSITYVNREMLPIEQLEKGNGKIDLSENPFACTCNLLWFRNWMIKAKMTEEGNYSCSSPDTMAGKNLLNFYLSSESCKTKYVNFEILTAIILGSLSLITIIIGICCVKCRYLQLWAKFLKEYTRKHENTRNPRERDFVYSAFVCYSEGDRSWIKNKLLPTMEVKEGLRFCIHDRDFIPGYPIITNIQNSIERSQKIMLVLSTNFLESSWCMYELNLAIHYDIEEKRNSLIPVLLQEIPLPLQVGQLGFLMKKKTYLEWSDRGGEQYFFWKRLKLSFSQDC